MVRAVQKRQEQAREERRRLVADMRLRGYESQAAIARKLGVSVGTINGDFQAINAQWREERVAIVDIERDKDRKRLERMMRAIWPEIVKGNLAAIGQGLKILERRARLLGLDTPMLRMTDPDPLEPNRPEVDVSVEALARHYAALNGLEYGDVLEGTLQLIRGASSIAEGKRV